MLPSNIGTYSKYIVLGEKCLPSQSTPVGDHYSPGCLTDDSIFIYHNFLISQYKQKNSLATMNWERVGGGLWPDGYRTLSGRFLWERPRPAFSFWPPEMDRFPHLTCVPARFLDSSLDGQVQ